MINFMVTPQSSTYRENTLQKPKHFLNFFIIKGTGSPFSYVVQPGVLLPVRSRTKTIPDNQPLFWPIVRLKRSLIQVAQTTSLRLYNLNVWDRLIGWGFAIPCKDAYTQNQTISDEQPL